MEVFVYHRFALIMIHLYVVLYFFWKNMDFDMFLLVLMFFEWFSCGCHIETERLKRTKRHVRFFHRFALICLEHFIDFDEISLILMDVEWFSCGCHIGTERLKRTKRHVFFFPQICIDYDKFVCGFVFVVFDHWFWWHFIDFNGFWMIFMWFWFILLDLGHIGNRTAKTAKTSKIN